MGNERSTNRKGGETKEPGKKQAPQSEEKGATPNAALTNPAAALNQGGPGAGGNMAATMQNAGGNQQVNAATKGAPGASKGQAPKGGPQGAAPGPQSAGPQSAGPQSAGPGGDKGKGAKGGTQGGPQAGPQGGQQAAPRAVPNGPLKVAGAIALMEQALADATSQQLPSAMAAIERLCSWIVPLHEEGRYFALYGTDSADQRMRVGSAKNWLETIRSEGGRQKGAWRKAKTALDNARPELEVLNREQPRPKKEGPKPASNAAQPSTAGAGGGADKGKKSEAPAAAGGKVADSGEAKRASDPKEALRLLQGGEVLIGQAAVAARSSGQTMDSVKAAWRIADAFQVRIQFRKTNKWAADMIKAGNSPKPEALKMKTINQLDVDLGVGITDAQRGLVGFFAVTALPPNASEALKQRAKQRNNEFSKYADAIKQLQAEGFVEVRGNLVYDVRPNSAGKGKAFTGDNDVFLILDAMGQKVDKGLGDAVLTALKDPPICAQHGAHMDWRSPDKGAMRTKEKMIDAHRETRKDGKKGEPLVEFGPGRQSRLVFAE